MANASAQVFTNYALNLVQVRVIREADRQLYSCSAAVLVYKLAAAFSSCT